MALGLIKKNDICEKFLVTEKYGENAGNWPRETIAAFKIICTDEDGKERVSHQVYRSDASEHAEVKLINYLENNSLVTSSKKISVMVYQNYSPCSECADKICDYIQKTKNAEITIAFANFYKTHSYPGNPQTDVDKNIKGLKKLLSGVRLKLLGEHVEWKTFLDMSEFFNLTEEEKKECLKKAASKERKDREEVDQKFLDDKITGAEDIASALAKTKLDN